MIPIQWTAESHQENLPELLEKLSSQGGAIVEFRSVISAVVFYRISSKLYWVPRESSAAYQGLIASLPTLLLGWWSVQGFFWSISVIVSNILGGIDVTELFTTPPANGELSERIVRRIERQRKSQQWSFVFGLLFLLVVIIVFFVMPCLKK